MPAILQAAAIGVCHPKWEERPLLLCTLTPGAAVTPEQLSAHLRQNTIQRVAKRWFPDEILFVDQLPLTATGKVNQTELRRLYGRPTE